MKVLKSFYVLLAYAALSLTMVSCTDDEESKEGTIVLRNDSSFSNDNPITAELMECGVGWNSTCEIRATNSISRNNRATWTDVSPDVRWNIRVTDRDGRQRNTGTFSISFGETRRYKYDGSSISRIFD